MITTLARHDGRLVALGDLAPLGQLPADMVDKPVILDAKAAEWDGTTWKPTSPPLVALSGRAWEFRPAAGWPTETSPRRPFIREQQIGNMLFGPGPGGKDVPRYYVKEVYAPKPVGFGQAGKRMWLSTFAGLVAVDLP